MKKFNLRKRLTETRSAPKTPEIERGEFVNKKREFLRKWFYRSILLAISLFIVYILFKNLIIKDYEGLVKIEEIKITSPVDGYIIPFVEKGEIVLPNEPIVKINSVKLEEEIKTLQKQLETLNNQLQKLVNENKNRKLLEKVKLYAEKVQILSASKKDILATIKTLKRQKEEVEKYLQELKSQHKKMQNLYKIGIVSKPELNAIEDKILRQKEKLAILQKQISLEKEKLTKLTKLKKISKLSISKEPLLVDIEYIKRDISLIKGKLEQLKKIREMTYIKYPFKSRIAEIYPKGKYVYKDEIIGKALNLEKIYVEAYVSPKEVKDLDLGKVVKVITPDGEEIIGRIDNIGTNVILTPSILVGPLERKKLTLPILIKLEGGKSEKFYNNMPVIVKF